MDEKHKVETKEKQNSDHYELDSVSNSSNSQIGHKDADGNTVNLETRKLNQKLANPLAGRSREQLMAEGETFANKFGMEDLTEEFQKGAVLAQDPSAFESLSILSKEDKDSLRMEVEHKWSQPLRLYLLVICCSVAAAVQGVSISSHHPFLFLIYSDGRNSNQWCPTILPRPVRDPPTYK